MSKRPWAPVLIVILVLSAVALPAAGEILVDCSGYTIKIRDGNQCWIIECTGCAIYEDGELIESWDVCGAWRPCHGI